MAADIVALDHNIGHSPAVYGIAKIGKGKHRLQSPAGRSLDQIENSEEKEPNYDPLREQRNLTYPPLAQVQQ